MREFAISSILILFFSFLISLVGPWWSIAPVAFLITYKNASSLGKAFLSGFVGTGTLWFLWSGFIHIYSGGILSGRIGEMMNLPSGILLIPITALIGGILGGLAGWSGYGLKQAIQK